MNGSSAVSISSRAVTADVWSELHHQFNTQVVTANVEIRRKLDEIQEGGLALDRDVIFVDDEQEFGDKRRTMSATFFHGLGNQ